MAPSRASAGALSWFVVSGDQVGSQLIFELGDLIAEDQLAFLHTRDPQLIGHGQSVESLDGGVEILMFLTQAAQLKVDRGVPLDWRLEVHGMNPKTEAGLPYQTREWLQGAATSRARSAAGAG